MTLPNFFPVLIDISLPLQPEHSKRTMNQDNFGITITAILEMHQPKSWLVIFQNMILIIMLPTTSSTNKKISPAK